jgi:hypothetical protein
MKVFSNRFKDHQVQPPADMWERICRDLDEPSLRFREVLKPASIIPPEGIWEQLKEQLDTEQALYSTVPASRIKRLKQPLTVAASLLLLLMGGWWLANQFKDASPSPISNTTPGNITGNELTKSASPTPNEENVNQTLTETNNRKNIVAAIVPLRRQSGKNNPTSYPGSSPESSIQPELENTIAPSSPSFPVSYSHEPIYLEKWNETVKTSEIRDSHGQVREDIRHQDVPLGYVAVTNSAGHTAQLSSKLSRWKEFFFEDSKLSKNNFPSDPEWELKIRQWKSMVSNSELITASSGSLDITELIRMMQE